MHQIKIAAFDEEPLFRAGIIHVLNADPRIQVIAEGSSASEVLKLSKELSPDIIILDANLLDEGMSPIAALSSDVKIIILSANKTQVHAALAAGARGYVLKGVSRHEFLDAVWAVHRGDGYVSPALAMDIMDMMLNSCWPGKKREKHQHRSVVSAVISRGSDLQIALRGIKKQRNRRASRFVREIDQALRDGHFRKVERTQSGRGCAVCERWIKAPYPCSERKPSVQVSTTDL